MSDELRSILTLVAAGELDPGEAARLLPRAPAGAGHPAGSGHDPVAGDPEPAGSAHGDPTLTPGSPTPGSATPGSPTPGSPIPGSPIPGSPSPTDARPAAEGSDRVFPGAVFPEAGFPGSVPADAVPSGEPRRLVIRGKGIRLRVIADEATAGVRVEGPHVLREAAEAWQLEAGGLGATAPAAPGEGFRMDPPDLPSWLRWIPGLASGQQVTVRVRPDLPVDLDLIGCDAEAAGLRGPLRARASSGSVVIRGLEGSLDIAGTMSSVRVDARLTADSRVDIELGSAVLRLREGSDVRVLGSAELGEFAASGSGGAGVLRDKGDGGEREITVGSGAAVLQVRARLASAKVVLP